LVCTKFFTEEFEIMSAAADPVIARLAKDADMRSKSILEPTSDVPESAIVIHVRRSIIELLI